MNRNSLVVLLAGAATVFTASVASAAIEIISPAPGSTVALVPDNQKAVMAKVTIEERQAVFVEDAKNGRKIKHGIWRAGLPFRVEWRVTEGETGPWEILIATREDLSDAKQYLFRASKADQATGREGAAREAGVFGEVIRCANLEIAKRYYLRVSSNLTCGKFGHGRRCECQSRRPCHASAVVSFTTEDLAPRWIEIEGTTGNFRDLGGRIGLGGRRVRQGMIYRSQGLNHNSVDGVARGRNRLTCEDVELLKGDYGIRTDLDLRTGCEAAGLNGVSPLGRDVRYVRRSSQCYAGIFTDSGRKTMAENFREFTDRGNYPILFHCIGGADRTGSLGYVLNGVLGVKRQELETDWESTFYPNIPDFGSGAKADPDHFWCMEKHFTRGFAKYGDAGTSWNDRIVLYLKDCGITDAEIETFREIMLEGKQAE